MFLLYLPYKCCCVMIKSREELKTYFETGDIPTEEQFADLIDTMVIPEELEGHVVDTTHIADGAVTTPKIADKAVVKEKLSEDLQEELEELPVRITNLRKIVIWSNDTSDVIAEKFRRFQKADGDSTVLYFNTGTDEAPGTYVALVVQKVGSNWNLMGYYPVNPSSWGFGSEQFNKVLINTSAEGKWIIRLVDSEGKFTVTAPQTLTAAERNQVRVNIDAGSKAIRINYGDVEAAKAAIEQFNDDPQKTVILVNYNGIRCVATVSFTANPFLVAYVPEGVNLRKLLFRAEAWSEAVIYGDSVRYGVQTLTDAQQSQARRNIKALKDAEGVIDTAKIVNKAITRDKLADKSVTTSRIENLNVTTEKIANGAITEEKIADGSITGGKFSPGLTLYMNQQFTYLKQVQVQYGEDPSAAIKSFAQRDNKTALYIKLTNGLLVPANTNGETASGLYSYKNTVRKVLFDGTNWSDVEIQNDIIDTAHIKDGAVTSDKIADNAITTPKITNGAVIEDKLDDNLKAKVNDNVKVIGQSLTSSEIGIVFQNLKFIDAHNNFFADKEIYDEVAKLSKKPIGCIFGIMCSGNTFGRDCIYNIFMSGSGMNTLKDNCNYNILRLLCTSNSFGNNCDSNSLGNNCTENSFGNDCDFNTLGNNCEYNLLGNYLKNSKIDTGVSHIVLKSNASRINPLKNIHILSGVKGPDLGLALIINIPDEYLNSSRELIITTKVTGGGASTPEDIVMYYADEVVTQNQLSEGLATIQSLTNTDIDTIFN